MRQSFKVVLSLGLVLSGAGCGDYLSGPGVDQDPNNVTSLKKAGPLYIGIQAAGPPQREGQLARYAAMYTQQLAGVARQQADFDLYGAAASDIDTYFGAIYGTSNVLTGGGGLLDIHKLQQLGRAAGDSLYVGIGKVYEAMYMGLAADLFGDIPYRQAADSTILRPAFDPQLQVYADLQTQLDSAITIFLAAAGPTNLGPSTDAALQAELIYQGRAAAGLRTVYTAVAHSLKARLYMHTAEVNPAAYALALAEVPLGIATPADDFLWFHDLTASGANIWWQFNSARTGDLAPGAALTEIVKRRIAAGVEDALRIGFYFTPTASGGFFGNRPGGTTNMPTNGVIYNGNGDPADASFSGFGASFDGASASSGFRQPEITFAETQLIGAEAAVATGGSGQTFLDAARANRTYGTQVFGPAPGALPATLQNIIEEKYVTLFLNPEVWNDYKRTCLPSLATAPTSTAPGSPPRPTPIPGRLPYGQSEQNANPNVPSTNSAGQPVTSTGQNPNDPNPCPVLDYTSSTPLAN
jgi:starch-binding outer membrane protein, SusD/RagB family